MVITVRNKTIFKTLTLITGQIGAKLLSLLFIYVLSKKMNNIGLFYYSYAFIPYSIFKDMSAFGLIPGVSSLTSKLISEENDNKVKYLLKIGTYYSIFLGVIFFILLNLFAKNILSISLENGYQDNNFNIILINIRVASLSLLIVPIINFYRGYLQGHLKMLPTALSLLLENLFKIILILSVINIFNFDNLRFALYFEFFGYILALIILFSFVYKDYKLKNERFNALYNIMKSTILYGIVTLFFTFYTFIDTLTLSGIGIESSVYTAYMFEAIRIVFLPVTLAQSIGAVLNPKINSLVKSNKYDSAIKLARTSTNAAIIILIPLISILKLYSKEIYQAFYHSGENYMVLYHLSSLIFFIGFYKVLIGILNSLPKFNYIIITTFISVLSKLVLNYILGEKIGYLGIMYSTIISISVCIIVSYYILYNAKIKIIFNNLSTLFTVVVATLISYFLSVLYRIIYLYNSFTFVVELILYSIIFIGIYMSIITGIIWFKKSTKEVELAYTSVGCDRCE